VALLGLAVIQPILQSFELFGARLFLNVFFTIILFSSLHAVSGNKRLFIITLFLGISSCGARWVVEFLGSSLVVLVAIQCVIAIFLLIITWTILSYVLEAGPVTGEKISAAIGVYMLFGLFWAFLFSLTYSIEPGAFALENADISHFVYYSFITLSTLGYGDITPLLPPARALSYVEAIAGQIYLTVLVARLVGLHIAGAKAE
jgi:hypothetical protein